MKKSFYLAAAIPSFGACHRILPGILCGALLSLPACKPANNEAGAAGGTQASPSADAKSAGGSESSGGKKASSAPSIPDLPPLDHPAKVAEAAKALDFEQFEIMPGVEKGPGERSLAHLTYRATGDVKAAFEFNRAKLQALGWKELPGTAVQNEYASATFQRGGFHVSLTISPTGGDGKVDVMMANHGNVDFTKVPLPPNLTKVYEGPITAIYTAGEPVAATAETCQKLLQAAGWQPYGFAGDSKYYKQNAVLLTVMVSSAPAQGGKTMINLGSEQLSADLPALPDAQDLRYTDQTGRLDYQTPATRADVEKFYRTSMGTLGWEPTLDHAIEDKGRFFVIFRNPEKAMTSLYMSDVKEGGTKVQLEYLSPTQFAEMDRRATEQGEKLKAKLAAEKNAPKPQLKLKLPAGATGVKKESSGVEFTVTSGNAKAAVNDLRKQCSDLGWTEEIAVLENIGGTVSLKKDPLSLSISYTDSGVTPAEVNLMLVGGELTVE
ncbi:hypothetical protein [Roseimicrobium sp. ORNL1]|uniref:hypothetical protein n=1 Tax=Roseimicrobium sp. ORNL1 TaxID=2711231 RepID=UPI0013E1B380|nr:hypothetical protein [Roseimicrobium sp. ORNL1]QIF03753.1 hypothetical protein G5S37_20250 [Roseimicrobium sp. ORNL1]